MEPLGQPIFDPVPWPEPVRARLDALFDGLSFPTSTSFRLADDPPVKIAGLSDESNPEPLVEALWPVLYERCYARTFSPATPGDPVVMARPHRPDPEFVSRLSAAHATQGRWDPAWQVYQVGGDGSIHAQKGDACRRVQPGQYAFAADPNRPPRVGESVDLLATRESFVAQAGFYFAHGEALGCDFDLAHQSRIYFHATAQGMPGLLALLGDRLNRHEVPFRLKCRDDPFHYDRTDAAVLFVPARYLTITLRFLDEVDGTLDDHLRAGSPLFTRELRPGVGLADNPVTSDSFGQIRCLLLAWGLVDAQIAGRLDREGRHRAVADRFARVGLDPARPHLNPGSADPYRWPDRGLSTSLDTDLKRPGLTRGLESTSSAPFLEVADRIGRRLCRDALWAGDRCNWMIWTTEELSGQPTPVHRAAPPDLYDGVAGIALFLAHLQRFTHDRQQRIALGGAIRQLLATGSTLRARGYYKGQIGVGHALETIGELLGDADLLEAGIALMSLAIEAEDRKFDSLDIFEGLAGAISPWIDVADRRDRPELLEMARRAGRQLLDRAVESAEGTSWPGPTGHLHGPAGIAWAFLELDRVRPDPRLRAAAIRALTFDRKTVMSASEGPAAERNGPATAPMPISPASWCHGTTGEGVARLRIRELLGDDPGLSTDLEATLKAASTSLLGPDPSGVVDFSLCHGLTGCADFLLLAAEILNRSDLRLAAEEFGRMAIDGLHWPNLPWPCGVRGAGETPDLMQGTAGIGLFFLRLHEPEIVPSPLLVRRSKAIVSPSSPLVGSGRDARTLP